jgi:hypothetical protein
MVRATAGEETVPEVAAAAVSEAVKTAASNAVEVMVPSCHPAKTARIVLMNRHFMNNMTKTRVLRITRTRVADGVAYRRRRIQEGSS